MANLCNVCGKKTGLFTQVKIKDGYVCGDCQRKSLLMSNCSCRTAEDYKNRYAYLEENAALASIFAPTITVGDCLQVDETNKLFRIEKSPECFPFSYLVNFELNEDGESVTGGGLGRAVVGGTLLGGVGAVVGGITGGKKSKTMVKSMYIRISLNDQWVKAAKIVLVSTEIKKGGFLYNLHKATADDIVSALEVILQAQNTQAAESQKLAPLPESAADEILKYKQLLDMGAITDEEYAHKKKQLLGV